MGLSEELKAINSEQVMRAFIGHNRKIDGLSHVGRAQDELEGQVENYPGLSEIPEVLGLAFSHTRFTPEEVEFVVMGASMAIHTLIEIAEVGELPSIDE